MRLAQRLLQGSPFSWGEREGAVHLSPAASPASSGMAVLCPVGSKPSPLSLRAVPKRVSLAVSVARRSMEPAALGLTPLSHASARAPIYSGHTCAPSARQGTQVSDKQVTLCPRPVQRGHPPHFTPPRSAGPCWEAGPWGEGPGAAGGERLLLPTPPLLPSTPPLGPPSYLASSPGPPFL